MSSFRDLAVGAEYDFMDFSFGESKLSELDDDTRTEIADCLSACFTQFKEAFSWSFMDFTATKDDHTHSIQFNWGGNDFWVDDPPITIRVVPSDLVEAVDIWADFWEEGSRLIAGEEVPCLGVSSERKAELLDTLRQWQLAIDAAIVKATALKVCTEDDA